MCACTLRRDAGKCLPPCSLRMCKYQFFIQLKQGTAGLKNPAEFKKLYAERSRFGFSDMCFIHVICLQSGSYGGGVGESNSTGKHAQVGVLKAETDVGETFHVMVVPLDRLRMLVITVWALVQETMLQ